MAFQRIPQRLQRPLLALACSSALLALPLHALAQTGTSSANTGTAGAVRATMDRSDRSFIEKAAQGGMAEVQMGQMAQQKAASQPVKDFGARMVQDHGKANTELQQLAASKGLQLPADAGRSHKKDAEKFAKMDGAKFDREYMEHMVKDHKKDVSDFEKASRDAKDPDVKAFAARTLPTLQEHLKLAQTTHDAVKNSK